MMGFIMVNDGIYKKGLIMGLIMGFTYYDGYAYKSLLMDD